MTAARWRPSPMRWGWRRSTRPGPRRRRPPGEERRAAPRRGDQGAGADPRAARLGAAGAARVLDPHRRAVHLGAVAEGDSAPTSFPNEFGDGLLAERSG